MKSIALKIDVDTCRGALLGVPRLMQALQEHQASATFFFSLGPDRSGCEPRIGSLHRYYDLGTRLYGRLLPAPHIAKRTADVMRQTRDAGFEVELHAWNRALWEKTVRQGTNAWTATEMNKGHAAFSSVFSIPPQAHAAPGWLMNRHALRLTQRLGYAYSSDCRGSHPFIPVIDGEIVNCPQIPTTLPTLDELLSIEGQNEEIAVERLLQLSEAIEGDHVFTLRTEIEGMRFNHLFTRLLEGWKARNYALVALKEISETLTIADLPRHYVEYGEIAGRKGARLIQGAVFPDSRSSK